MSSLFQEMEEFTLFDGLVPSTGVDCGLGVEDVFDTGFVIPGDSLVKDDIGSGLFEELTESFEDGLSQDWMETMDLGNLLDCDKPMEVQKVALKNTTKSSLLEELLNGPITIKSSPAVSVYSSLDNHQNDTCDSLDGSISKSTHVNTETVHQESSKSILEEAIQEIQGLDALLLSQQLEELYNSSISSSGTSDNSVTSEEVVSLNISNTSNQFSPLTSDDIDSILSGSEPASPSDSFDNDPDYSPYASDDNSSKKSTGKSRKQSKARSSPYDKPVDKLDKKERKKIQNRNAALRYREKKRQERGVIHTEEDILLAKNKDLKKKVEHLSNEISYMKNLLTEVCEARGLKIQFK